MTGPPGPEPPALPDAARRAVAAVLGETFFEWDPLGVRVYRERVTPAQLRRIERLLSADGSVRVLDFRMGAEDLEENLIAPEGPGLADYAGVPAGSNGTRIFRVDHHYDRPEFEGESTTPLVLRYLRALRGSGREEVIREFCAARFLADHADPDILYSNYLAHSAARDGAAFSPLGDHLAAAAYRNDYIRLPDEKDEPFASRLYYAGIGLEEAILRGDAGFGETLRERLPHLRAWLDGRAESGVASALDRFEAESREREAAVLRDIDGWRREGLLTRHAGGRVAYLDAPRKIENSDLFLYFTLASRNESPPDAQILRYPRRSRAGLPAGPLYMYKLRAHGRRNLVPVFTRLRERWPAAGFDGRSAAGGSRGPIPEIPRDDLIETVLAAL